MSGKGDKDEEIKSPRSKSPVMGVTGLLRDQSKGSQSTAASAAAAADAERRASAGGILRLDPNKPRRRSSATSAEFKGEDPASPCASDRLSVTWADGEKSVSSGEASVTLKGRAENLSANPSLTTLRPASTPRSPPPEFAPRSLLEEPDNMEEDFEASISVILQRSASMRGSKMRKTRRKSRRTSSSITSSSGGSGGILDSEDSESKAKLYQEVLSGIKQQPWPISKKLNLSRMAREFLAKHEGELEERLAQSTSTKDVLYRYFIRFRKITQAGAAAFYNWVMSIELWQKRIKRIESHFGSAVASYFTFLRWVIGVNTAIALLLAAFVIIPETLAGDWRGAGERKRMVEEEKYSAFNLKMLWDFEGILRYSPVFYGFYGKSKATKEGYRVPLAYILTFMCVYGFSFVAILRKMAANSRLSKLGDYDETVFTFRLFSAWDYTIGNAEAAQNKVASINIGFKESLLEAREAEKEVKSWKITAKRGLAHFLVLCLLLGSAYAVVLLVDRSKGVDANASWWRQNELTVILTLISIIFPNFFDLVGMLENHHPRKQLQWQLARIMALNLLNLYTLIFALFGKVNDMSKELSSVRQDLEQPTFLHQFIDEWTLPSSFQPVNDLNFTTATVATSIAASSILVTFNFTDSTNGQSNSSTTGDPNTTTVDMIDMLLEVRPGCKKIKIPCLPPADEARRNISYDFPPVNSLEMFSNILNTSTSSTFVTNVIKPTANGEHSFNSPTLHQVPVVYNNFSTASSFPQNAIFNIPIIDEVIKSKVNDSVNVFTNATENPENVFQVTVEDLETKALDSVSNVTTEIHPVEDIPSTLSDISYSLQTSNATSSTLIHLNVADTSEIYPVVPATDNLSSKALYDLSVGFWSPINYTFIGNPTDEPDSTIGKKITEATPTTTTTPITSTPNPLQDLSKAFPSVIRPFANLFPFSDVPFDMNSTEYFGRLKREIDTSKVTPSVDTKGKQTEYLNSNDSAEILETSSYDISNLHPTAYHNDPTGTEGTQILDVNQYHNTSDNYGDTEGNHTWLLKLLAPTTSTSNLSSLIPVENRTISNKNLTQSDSEPYPDYHESIYDLYLENKTSHTEATDSVSEMWTIISANDSTSIDTPTSAWFGNHSTPVTAEAITYYTDSTTSTLTVIPTSLPDISPRLEFEVTTETATPGTDAITEVSTPDSVTTNGTNGLNTDEYPHYLDNTFGSDQHCFTYIEICNETDINAGIGSDYSLMENSTFFNLSVENSTSTSLSQDEEPPTTPVPTTTVSPEFLARRLPAKNRTRLRKLCWETMFGQEIIKLTVMDLVLTAVSIIIGDYIRAIFVRVCNNCCCWDLEKQFPGYPDFKIAENILHLVNNQGLVWMGMFFSPGLPALNLAKLIILLYVRSWAVVTSNVPPETVFKASDNNNFYLALLLVMLFLCTLPVGYAVVWLTPSWHCGPFSDYRKIYQLATETFINSLPDWCEPIIDYISSPGVVIPGGLLLILIIYYLVSLTAALREAVQDLKDQLRRERNAEKKKAQEAKSAKRVETPASKWGRLLQLTPLPSHRFDRKEPDRAKFDKSDQDDKAPLLEEEYNGGKEVYESPIPDDITDLGHSEVFDDSLSEPKKASRDAKSKVERLREAATSTAAPVDGKKHHEDKKTKEFKEADYGSLPRSPKAKVKHKHPYPVTADVKEEGLSKMCQTSRVDSPKSRDVRQRDSPKTTDGYHRDSPGSKDGRRKDSHQKESTRDTHRRDSPKARDSTQRDSPLARESYRRDSPKARDSYHRDSPQKKRSSKTRKDSPNKPRVSSHRLSDSDNADGRESGPKITQPSEIEKISKEYPELGDVFEPKYGSGRDKHRKHKRPIPSSPAKTDRDSPKRPFSLKHKRDHSILSIDEVCNEQSPKSGIEKEHPEEPEMQTIPIIKISKEDSVERSIEQAKLERQSKTDEAEGKETSEKKDEMDKAEEITGQKNVTEQQSEEQLQKQQQSEEQAQQQQQQSEEWLQKQQQSGEQLQRQDNSEILITDTKSKHGKTDVASSTPSPSKRSEKESRVLETDLDKGEGDIDEIVLSSDAQLPEVRTEVPNIEQKVDTDIPEVSISFIPEVPQDNSGVQDPKDCQVVSEVLAIDPEVLKEYEQVRQSFEDEKEMPGDDQPPVQEEKEPVEPRYKSRKPPKLKLPTTSHAKPEDDDDDLLHDGE